MPMWPKAVCGTGTIIDATAHIGYPAPRTLSNFDATLDPVHLAPSSIAENDAAMTALHPTTIGARATVRALSVIYEGVAAGMRLDVAHSVIVREDVCLGDDCYLKCFADIRRSVTIGHRCIVAGLVGDRSILADDVTMLGSLVHVSRDMHRGKIEVGPTVEQHVFIGRGAVIVGPVTVGESAYVSAGVVVRDDVAPGAHLR